MQREHFLTGFNSKSQAFENYLECYVNASQALNKNGLSWEFQCIEKHDIDQYCGTCTKDRQKLSTAGPAHVERAIEAYCPEYLKMAHFAEKGEDGRSLAAKWNVPYDAKKYQSFLQHHQCLNDLSARADRCMKQVNLTEHCLSSTIRLTKILRLKMPFISEYIEAIPDIHIVYYVRDPRAIMSSRVREGSANLLQRWKNGVLQLCDEMTIDLNTFEKLHLQYPGVFLKLKYEDLVAQPNGTIEKLYDLIGTEPYPESFTWLMESLYSSENGPYKRQNATLIVHRWRSRFSQLDIDEVSNHPLCNAFLRNFDYL